MLLNSYHVRSVDLLGSTHKSWTVWLMTRMRTTTQLIVQARARATNQKPRIFHSHPVPCQASLNAARSASVALSWCLRPN